jgi:hypothetical protein
MKTARIALLLVMMLVLVACTQSQRRSAMSLAANTLLASLLDAQRNAPLTQSSFRPQRVVVTEPEPDADDESEAAVEPLATHTSCPLAPLPIASSRLSDIAAHAAGVMERMPARTFVLKAQQMAIASAKSAVIERCRYIRDANGKHRIVVRAEITVPGDAIIIQGLDDFSL